MTPEERVLQITNEFERQFSQIESVDCMPVRYLDIGTSPPSSLKTYTLEHREIRGDGYTADEAIADWRSKLPTGAYRMLIWRVKPEIVSERDFDTKLTRWRVWSRFAMAENAAA